LSGGQNGYHTASRQIQSQLRGEALELVGLDDGHARALDGDPLVPAKLVQQPGDRLARSPGHVGDLFMRQGHGEADFRLAGGRSASQSSNRRANRPAAEPDKASRLAS